MKKIFLLVFFLFHSIVSFSQAWVMDEIADEARDTDPISSLDILLLCVIGAIIYVVYEFRQSVEKHNEEVRKNKIKKEKEENRIRREARLKQIYEDDGVDLGLSVKWAKYNLGAFWESDFGTLLSWADNGEGSCLFNDKIIDISGDSKHDPARNTMGIKWRLPRKEEFLELADKCTWTLEKQYDNYGYRVTGPNGNSIFLPSMKKNILEGYYWTLKEVRKQVGVALQGKQCEDRIVNNWCVPLAALRVLQDAVPTLAYDDLFKIVIEGILKQNAECKTNGELGSFWNVVQYLASEGIINDTGDFVIRYLTKLKTDMVDTSWLDKRAVLYMQTSRIFNLYRKEGRKTDEKTLPTDALKYYLANSAAYLGQKVVRFIVFRNGYPVLDSAKQDKHGNPAKLSQSARSYCFDYQKLVDQFGINLVTGDSDDEEE